MQNEQTHDDVSVIRDSIPIPTERNYRVRLTGSQIRVEFGGPVMFGAREELDVFKLLDERGYRLFGGNMDTGMLAFKPREED